MPEFELGLLIFLHPLIKLAYLKKNLLNITFKFIFLYYTTSEQLVVTTLENLCLIQSGFVCSGCFINIYCCISDGCSGL